MTPDFVFSLVNALALPAWLLLIFLPYTTLTRKVVHSGLYSAVFGVLYAALLFSSLSNADTSAGFDSIAGLRTLFSSDWALLTGWVHYLAFDILAGSWMVKHNEQAPVNGIVMGFALFFTFMSGPFGLVLYLIARVITDRLRVQPKGV